MVEAFMRQLMFVTDVTSPRTLGDPVAKGLVHRTMIGRCTNLAFICVIVLSSCSSSNAPPATEKGGSGASITADPNPVPTGEKFGTTTITWKTGDGSVAEVYVSHNGGPEKLFAGNRPKGSLEAKWIGKGEYEFRLYAGKAHEKLLASVKVTRSAK